MDKQYKEWIQEQTFETLATDNYNTKLLLLAEQSKNKKLVEFIKDKYYKCDKCCGDKETAEVYCEGKCGHWCSHYEVRQALNEVNK